MGSACGVARTSKLWPFILLEPLELGRMADRRHFEHHSPGFDRRRNTTVDRANPGRPICRRTTAIGKPSSGSRCPASGAHGFTGGTCGGATGGKSRGRVIDDLPNGKIRFAAIYGTGAAIGFTPQEVNEMTMWQFMAAVDGYIQANSQDDGKSLSKKEADDIWKRMQEITGAVQ